MADKRPADEYIPNGSRRVRIEDETLSGWIAACDPHSPIDPTDSRYFDFGKLSGEGVDLRGEDHIGELYKGIALSGESSCQLFSGFSGTGKSTELRRLKKRLDNAGYAALLVDARDYHDLNHPLKIEDLIIILAGAFGDATAEVLGKDVELESYWDRIRGFLESEVELEPKVRVGVGDLKLGIKHAKPFWVRLRAALANAPKKLRVDAHDYVRGSIARITESRSESRGVVFIVDSLERLGASMLDFNKMMESLIQVLTESPDYLHLPDCHVIYSIPPYVRLIRPNLGDYYSRVSLVLPAIKVVERGPKLVPYQPGIEALSILVGRRIPLERVFGDRRDLLQRLIVYSGGHVRTLLVFVRELLFKASDQGFPPSEQDVERAVQPFREQAHIWRGTAPLLAEIIRTGSLKNISREDYAVFAEYMDSYIVLCYRNGEGWYEVHPLVRGQVLEFAAEEGS